MGLEPMNLILTKNALYQLSYAGVTGVRSSEPDMHRHPAHTIPYRKNGQKTYNRVYAFLFQMVGRAGFEPA